MPIGGNYLQCSTGSGGEEELNGTWRPPLGSEVPQGPLSRFEPTPPTSTLRAEMPKKASGGERKARATARHDFARRPT